MDCHQPRNSTEASHSRLNVGDLLRAPSPMPSDPGLLRAVTRPGRIRLARRPARTLVPWSAPTAPVRCRRGRAGRGAHRAVPRPRCRRPACVAEPAEVRLTGGFLHDDRWAQLVANELGVATSCSVTRTRARTPPHIPNLLLPPTPPPPSATGAAVRGVALTRSRRTPTAVAGPGNAGTVTRPRRARRPLGEERAHARPAEAPVPLSVTVAASPAGPSPVGDGSSSEFEALGDDERVRGLRGLAPRVQRSRIVSSCTSNI